MFQIPTKKYRLNWANGRCAESLVVMEAEIRTDRSCVHTHSVNVAFIIDERLCLNECLLSQFRPIQYRAVFVLILLVMVATRIASLFAADCLVRSQGDTTLAELASTALEYVRSRTGL